MTPSHALPRVTLPGVSPEATAEVDALVEAARQENGERIRFGIKRAISLHRKGKHVYMGTVSAKVKARRRAANRVASTARKVNR